jgi:gliding motility-associated-like protein
MIVRAIRNVFLLWLLCSPGIVVFSQPHASRNNYSGAWETPESWNPTWAVPQTNISGYDITINGYITSNTSISIAGTASMLNINDTLVINGNLTLDNNNDVTVNDNGILIVRGNLTISNQTILQTDGYLIVTGDIIKASSIYQGSFTSNDNPVKVFVGGVITSPGLTANNPDYPVLNCTAPTTDPYPNSACSYGNMTDIEDDPIFSFFQSTCTTVNINSNSPVCAGNSLGLNSTGGTGYNWSGPNGFTSNAQNPSILNADATMAGDYTVTVTAATGCTVMATTSVIVKALPAVNAGPDATIPNGTSTTLNATVTGTGPFDYSWSPPSQLVNASVEDPATVILSLTTVFTLTVTSSATSCSGTDEVIITISGGPLGSIPTATPGTICTGEETELMAMASGGSGSYTYSWTSTPAGFTSSVNNVMVSPAVSTTYHVAVFDGFTTVNSQITVTVNAKPDMPTITSDGPVTFCAGEGVTLTSSAGSSYLWSTGETTPGINVSTEGSYSVRVTNASGCQSEASAATLVTVNSIPATPIILADGPTTFCTGDSVTLTADAGSTYLWSTGATTPDILVTTAGNYTVKVTNASGCESPTSAPVLININALPTVIITSSNSAMCLNDLRTLTGDPAGGTFIIAAGPGSITGNILSANGIGNIDLVYHYTDACTNEAAQSIIVTERPVSIPGPDQELNFVFETQMNAELSPSETGEWSLVSGSGQLSDLHSPTAGVTELSVGDNIFLWKVANGGCEASAEVKITVYDLFVPSVITPNGDGKNDYFSIGENDNQVELIIFNRWGNEEFNSKNYLNDWNGENNHGDLLPNDTYFFILKFENGVVKKGSVLILR